MTRVLRHCLGAAVALLALVAASPAAATTFCVHASGCTGTIEPDLQTALNAAAAATPGPNTVTVGAGTYTGPFDYNAAPQLTLTGAGAGSTVLAFSGTSKTGLSIAGNSSDTVSDLTVQAGAGSTQVGLNLGGGGTATRVAVTMPAGGTQVTGVYLSGDANLTHSTVNDSADQNSAVVAAGAAVVADDAITGYVGVEAQGGSGAAFVLRDRVTSPGIGVACEPQTQAQTCLIQDSLFLMQSGSSVGIDAICGSANATVGASNVTIVGPVDRGVEAACGFNALTASINLTSSIVVGATAALHTGANSGGTATVAASYDDYNSATDTTAGGTIDASGGGNVNVDPQFVNPAGGVYNLRYSSPLIDAGSPAPLGLLESSTDLAGNPRVVNGRRDVGALEYQHQPPSASISGPTSGAVGQALAFNGSASSDPDPGDTLTYGWSFDDGATATGVAPSHTFTTAGQHTITLTVTDPTGLTGKTTKTVQISSTTGPGGPGGPGGTPGAPVLTQFAESVKRWRLGTKPATLTRARLAPVGTTFSFRLNSAATVKLAFTRVADGRVFGGRCVARTARNRTHRRCVLRTAAGSIALGAHTGLNRIRFAGRLGGGKHLTLGAYTVAVTATGSHGRTSAPKTLAFTIVAR